MGRKRLPGAQGRVHRKVHGLKVVERGTVLYIAGTLRIKGRSHRVRRSTGLDSRLPENWDHARDIRSQTEVEITQEVIHGVKPSILFSAAANLYLQKRRPGVADARNAEELAARFATDPVEKVTRERIERFYASRFKDASAATVRRHMNTLGAIFAVAVETGHLAAVPYWEKPRVRRRKGHGAMKMFHPGEAEYLIENAFPHARPIFSVLHATGARVGMTLWLPRENFILVEGRGRVFFPTSKNGNAYSRTLNDFAVRILREWVAGRRDRHAEMFLTPRGLPFVYRPGGGGHVKESFDRARQRLVDKLLELGREERARVVAEATPHWFRHNLANWLHQSGASGRDIADAGMWEDVRLVNDSYIADAPAHVEAAIKGLPFGANLTQDAEGERKDDEETGA